MFLKLELIKSKLFLVFILTYCKFLLFYYSNGEEWYKFRRKFQSLLLAGATGEACSGAIENVTEDLISKIPSKLDNNKEVDIQPLLFKWALECKLRS